MGQENYTIQQQVGKGAFGTAHIVFNKIDNERYVLKRVRLARQSPAERRASLQELALLASLRHRNILQFKECWVEGGCVVCCVVELCLSADLSAQMQLRQPKACYFAEEHLQDVVVQLASALDLLHMNGIIHRDLKSANVLVTGEGCLKLADFGLSVRLESPNAQVKGAVGTPAYMAPELMLGLPYGVKSDMWGLGCVLYELAALKPAFHAFNMAGLTKKVTASPPPIMPTSYSEPLRALVRSLLSREAEDRPSAQQVLAMAWLQAAVARVDEKHGAPLPNGAPAIVVFTPLPSAIAAMGEEFERQELDTAKRAAADNAKLAAAQAKFAPKMGPQPRPTTLPSAPLPPPPSASAKPSPRLRPAAPAAPPAAAAAAAAAAQARIRAARGGTSRPGTPVSLKAAAPAVATAAESAGSRLVRVSNSGGGVVISDVPKPSCAAVQAVRKPSNGVAAPVVPARNISARSSVASRPSSASSDPAISPSPSTRPTSGNANAAKLSSVRLTPPRLALPGSTAHDSASVSTNVPASPSPRPGHSLIPFPTCASPRAPTPTSGIPSVPSSPSPPPQPASPTAVTAAPRNHLAHSVPAVAIPAAPPQVSAPAPASSRPSSAATPTPPSMRTQPGSSTRLVTRPTSPRKHVTAPVALDRPASPRKPAATTAAPVTKSTASSTPVRPASPRKLAADTAVRSATPAVTQTKPAVAPGSSEDGI